MSVQGGNVAASSTVSCAGGLYFVNLIKLQTRVTYILNMGVSSVAVDCKVTNFKYPVSFLHLQELCNHIHVLRVLYLQRASGMFDCIRWAIMRWFCSHPNNSYAPKIKEIFAHTL